MNHNKQVKKNRIRIILTNITMVLSILTIVVLLTFLILGYRLSNNLTLDRAGLVQFISQPSGATISIDGSNISSRTPAKSMLTSGEHTISFSRDGYGAWTKTVDVHPGRVIWLNYALLLPSSPEISTVKSYDTLVASSASPNSQYLLLLLDNSTALFELIDINGNDIKTISISAQDYLSGYGDPEVEHSFTIDSWNYDSNKVLLRHNYAEETEWFILDIKNPANSLNLTVNYKMSFSSIKFFTNDGRKLFVLEGGNLRRADIVDKTISAVLMDNVDRIANDGDTVTYVSSIGVDGFRRIGTYKDGDGGPSVLYVVNPDIAPIKTTSGEYYGAKYMAISENNKLLVLRGSYPTFDRPATSLSQVYDVDLDFTIENLEMGKNSRFIYATNKTDIYVFDLETLTGSYFKLDGEMESSPHLTWLNDFILYSTLGNKLTIYDFDGDNKRTIQDVLEGSVAAITSGSRYIYSINQATCPEPENLEEAPAVCPYQLNRLDLTAK